MFGPPKDADPEDFVIGRGCYHNQLAARVHVDEKVVRIDPAPTPWVGIVALNLLFAAFFGGLWLWIRYGGKGPPDGWLPEASLGGVALLTSVAYTALTCWLYFREQRRGTWLIFDRATGRVALPREGVEFLRDEVDHLQYITTKRLDLGTIFNNDQESELNLITVQNGVRRRWPLLQSGLNIRPFDRFLRPIAEHTDLPIERVVDSMFGWTVTKRSYRDG